MFKKKDRTRETADGEADRFMISDTPEVHQALARARIKVTAAKVHKIGGVYEDAHAEAAKIQHKYLQLDEILQPLLDKAIVSARSKRMALVSEHQQILRSVKDLKEVFCTSDARQTMDTMREFIDLATKFKTLTEAGVLEPILRAMCGGRSEL